MHRPSSFTSNSDAVIAQENLPRTSAAAPEESEASPRPACATRARCRQVFITAAWTLLFLVLIDVAINVMFAYPKNPAQRPTSMQMYFDYGRSIEGKVRRIVGNTPADDTLIAKAGWLKGNTDMIPPGMAAPGKIGVRVYGMSFSEDVVRAAAMQDSRLEVSAFGGPSAPASHSLAAFLKERHELQSDVVVLGMLASEVARLHTMTKMTSTFESPTVYNYPRYYLVDGKLQAVWPSINSLEEFRTARADPAKWAAYLRELSQHDEYYSDSLMGAAWLDGSSLARLVRRGWGQRHMRNVTASLHTAAGYTKDGDLVPLLQEIIATFAGAAREDHRLPLLLLLHDQGYADHLYKAALPVLERDAIPFVSTHEIAPASDPRNYLGDGHFTPDANGRIAAKLLEVMRREGVKPGE